MKQYPWKWAIQQGELRWYQTEKTLGSNHYFYYFGIALMDKEHREALRSIGEKPISLYRFWYDCPHAQLNLYYICFYWSTQWTKPPKDFK